ncbi:hypothetical protein SB781_36640, partial [Paraburkholderia sp. SIMBA_061]
SGHQSWFDVPLPAVWSNGHFFSIDMSPLLCSGIAELKSNALAPISQNMRALPNCTKREFISPHCTDCTLTNRN